MLFRLRYRCLLRRASDFFCHLSVLRRRAPFIILFTRIAAPNMLRRMNGSLARDLTLVMQTIQVKSRRRKRTPAFRGSFLRTRTNDRTSRKGSTRRFFHFKEGQTRTIFRTKARDVRVLIRYRSIRLTVRRRALTTTDRMVNERRGFRITFRLTFIRGLLTASSTSIYFRFFNVGINGLINLRFIRDFKRGLLVHLMT